MVKDTLINKVCEGFYASGKENKAVVRYQEELKFFSWILKTNPELEQFLNSPFLEEKEKNQSLDKLFSDVLLPEVLMFLKLLVSKRLIQSFQQIKTKFDSLALEDENILQGTIYTPFRLDDQQISKIQLAFAKKLNKNVIFNQIIDKEIIAGLRIILDSKLYEYSIDSKLNQVKEKLILNNKEKQNERK